MGAYILWFGMLTPSPYTYRNMPPTLPNPENFPLEHWYGFNRGHLYFNDYWVYTTTQVQVENEYDSNCRTIGQKKYKCCSLTTVGPYVNARRQAQD